MKLLLKKFLTSAFVILCIASACFGQTLTITDYNVEGCKYNSQREHDENTAKILGSKIIIEVFDTKIKLTSNFKGREEAVALNKVDDTTYRLSSKNSYGPKVFTLKLVKEQNVSNSHFALSYYFISK